MGRSGTWEVYPCELDGRRGWISVRTDLSGHLGALAPTLVRVRTTLEHANSAGLPTARDYETLGLIEDAFTRLVEVNRGACVGRVTVGGFRDTCFYGRVSAGAAADLGAQLMASEACELQVQVRDEPAYGTYRQRLYPSKADWQAIADGKVLEALRARGEALDVPRQIDHWARFRSEDAARAHEAWLIAAGYSVDPVSEPDPDEGGHRVVAHHVVVPEWWAVSAHTRAMAEQVEETGGIYEGWGVSG